MDLSKVLTVSGKSGLYELVTETKNGFIAETIPAGKRFPVFSHERISALEEISIFRSDDEDIGLGEIFKIMHEKHEGNISIDAKSDNDTLKAYFEEIVPNYDKERVYVSDIKKVLSWYNILTENELLDFSEETEEEKTDEDAEKPDDIEEHTAEAEKNKDD